MLDRRPRHARRVRHSDGVGSPFQDYLKALGEKGILDRKTRELLLAALACALQCPSCTELHVEEALKAGATREEVGEALLIAALEGTGTHTSWYADIRARYLSEEKSSPDGGSTRGPTCRA